MISKIGVVHAAANHDVAFRRLPCTASRQDHCSYEISERCSHHEHRRIPMVHYEEKERPDLPHSKYSRAKYLRRDFSRLGISAAQPSLRSLAGPPPHRFGRGGEESSTASTQVGHASLDAAWKKGLICSIATHGIRASYK